MSSSSTDHKTNFQIAIIGAIATIFAAIIGGVFVLFSGDTIIVSTSGTISPSQVPINSPISTQTFEQVTVTLPSSVTDIPAEKVLPYETYSETFDSGINKELWQVTMGTPTIIDDRLTALGPEALHINFSGTLSDKYGLELTFNTNNADCFISSSSEFLDVHFSNVDFHIYRGTFGYIVGSYFLRDVSSGETLVLTSELIGECTLNFIVEHFSLTASYKISLLDDKYKILSSVTVDEIENLSLGFTLSTDMFLDYVNINNFSSE